MKGFKEKLKTKFKKTMEEEKKSIEQARLTNVEKILIIMTNSLEKFDNESDKKDMKWAINKLQSGNLYEYEIDNYQKENMDFIDMLVGYTSITTVFKNSNNDLKRTNTSHCNLTNMLNFNRNNNDDNNPIKEVDEDNNNNKIINNSDFKDVIPNPRRNKKTITTHEENAKFKPKLSTHLQDLKIINENPRENNNNMLKFSKTKESNSSFYNNNSNKVIKLNKRKIAKSSYNYDSYSINNTNTNTNNINNTINFNNIYNTVDTNYNNNNILNTYNYTEKYVFTNTDINEYPDNTLQEISSFDFNIFKFSESHGRHNTLSILYKHIIKTTTENKLDEMTLDDKKLNSFINDIYNGYRRDVQYHNDLHGGDLLQTIFSWFNNSNLSKSIKLNNTDLFSFFTAAAIHDFKHPGTNNTFQINFLTDEAVTYNDASVLENYHIAESFKILQKPNSNVLESLTLDRFKFVRKRLIDTVLATDMANHGKTISNIKTKINRNEILNGENTDKLIDWTNNKTIIDDQQELFNFIIHLGDLSHNTKRFEISYKWTNLLHDEFFAQGDREKKALKPVSFLCDRDTTNIEKGQIGFIKGLISPCYELLVKIIPELDYTLVNIKDNLEDWNSLVVKKQDEKQE